MTIYRPGNYVPVSLVVEPHFKNRFFYAAETDVITRVVPAVDVKKWLDENPDEMFVLVRRLNRRLNEFLDRNLTFMAGTALSRVAYEIYLEGKKFGTLEAGGLIFIDLNERDIAARTGLTRETVNREIRKLKEVDCVKVERRGISVCDLERLEKKLYKKLL